LKDRTEMNAIGNRRLEIENVEIDLLLEAVYRMYGYDFRSYAKASIERRTRQFLSGCECATISEMIARVLHDEDFSSRLVQYFSITVTEMFRDPLVYRTLRTKVIPLLRTWPHFKVWHAGCATGEEVYSLAILLKEEGVYDRGTIYATDFNDSALERAREGVYPLEKIQEGTRNYQQAGGSGSFGQYYHSRYDAATMDGSLRERVTFASHNLVSDSVFGEMHLVFCRNVLIYFNADLKNRALGLFTDSLVHGGFLCVGTKEDLQFTGVHDRYEVVDRKARIYRKSEVGTRKSERGSRNAERGTRNARGGTMLETRINESARDELLRRTRAFALRAIKLANALPDTPDGRVIRGQLLRCGTSVGANYRAARRAKSRRDFISKMGTVEEETDESMYWMELIVEAGLMKEDLLSDLHREADEILAMVVSSIKTARKRQ